MALTLHGRLRLPEDADLYTRLCAAHDMGQRVPCRLCVPGGAKEADVEAYVLEVTEGPDVQVTFRLADERPAVTQRGKE